MIRITLDSRPFREALAPALQGLPHEQVQKLWESGIAPFMRDALVSFELDPEAGTWTVVKSSVENDRFIDLHGVLFNSRSE